MSPAVWSGNLQSILSHLLSERPRGLSVCQRHQEDLVLTFVQPEGVRTASGQVWHNPAGLPFGHTFYNHSGELPRQFKIPLDTLPYAFIPTAKDLAQTPLDFPELCDWLYRVPLVTPKLTLTKSLKKPVLHQNLSRRHMNVFFRFMFFRKQNTTFPI